jgi:cell division septation protein DedD
MADVDFEGPVRPALGTRASRIVQMGAAVLSLGLMAGVGLWGYRLAVRDVTGIPVVRAMEGPMRVAPDDPGGQVAAHQGLAVNGVAAAGTAAGPADQLVLAPAAMELAEDDAAGTMTAPVPETSSRAASSAGLALEAGADAAAIELAVTDAVNLSGSLDATGAPQPAPVARALPAGFVRPMPKPVWLGGAAVPAEPAAPAPDLGLSLESAPAASSATPTPATSPAEIDAATLQPGTRLVQLGAFETQDLAREEWLKLAARFGDLMAGKGRVIEAAQSGGRTFFRLRAHGFETETEARRFCAAFLSEQTACIPVTQR